MTTKPFTRIAIINRGEPALRLIRAVREWNTERNEQVQTVALYTDADRDALFVREADLSYPLGTPLFLDPTDLDESNNPRRKSRYLDYQSLCEALTATKADAAWVGWGFVSEHAAFADLCQELGVTFIGPSGEAMRKLGDKIGSKLLAESAHVPVTPWSGGPVASIEEARDAADRIGYPLLIKATAGGGGRGIRFVNHPDELAPAFQSAASEARKSFGDGTLFLESRVDAARHVEVQVVADSHGTVWAAGVRDCSVQRNNQKVIEEAPSPVLSPERSDALREAAVRIARAAGYVNAGTAEFLFEPATGDFYFMEMNTRLQVEHPVTEATTGLDLVRLQIAIARGEAIPDAPPPTQGHAIEVRLCAEDPAQNFAPAPGKVSVFRPAMGPGVRTDSGVLDGDTIPVEFDSMIAKLIAYGATREEARARLARALVEMLVVVDGGTTNRAFLLRLLEHPDFKSSTLDTRWLDRLMKDGFAAEPAPNGWAALVAAAIELHERQAREEELNFFALAARGRPALPGREERTIQLNHRNTPYELKVSTLEPGRFQISLADSKEEHTFEVALQRVGEREAWLTATSESGPLRHRIVSIPATSGQSGFLIEVDGMPHRIERDAGGLMRAPAPGLVLAFHTEVGAEVKAGDRLLSLEAMKMEIPVVAPFDGRVKQLCAAPGVQVAAGQALLAVEATGNDSSQTERGERLSFPHTISETTTTRALHRLMLGFDAPRANAHPDALPDSLDDAGELLSLYLDVEEVFSKHYSEVASGLNGFSREQCLHLYLRELPSEGKGLPESFLQCLKTALRRYAVKGLTESDRLREALVRLFRSHAAAPAKDRVLIALLQGLIERAEWSRAARTSRFRSLLDRLVALTQGVNPRVSELAAQARYALFQGIALEEQKQEALARVDRALEKLRANPESTDRAGLFAEVAATPFSLLGHLAPKLTTTDPVLGALYLESIARRLYRPRALSEPCALFIDERPVMLVPCDDQKPVHYVLSTCTPTHEVPRALARLERSVHQLGAENGVAPAWLDLFVLADGTESAVEDHLMRLPADGSIARLCLIFIPEAGRPLDYRTFVPQDGVWSEETVLRGFHPTSSERLELWRMEHFSLRQIEAREDLHLFEATAQSNPKDQRLVALAEVRQVHPVRDGDRLVSVPELEHALLDAFAALRKEQGRRDARRRLHWNRVTLFVRQPICGQRDEIYAIARRLHPSAAGLGIEKVTLRMPWHEELSKVPREVALTLSDPTGHRLDLQIHAPHTEPLRALDDYALKLVQARQRRIDYPYEIVKLLAPQEPRGDVPAGHFEEFDLDGTGDRLLSVAGRPYGENQANIVVGLVQNFTEKHPEGMKRVILLGDGTREMGALAEGECRRIIAAIDLAEERGLPVEWFPVSSGAKIAMESGTENLDWTAAVLKRLIEFTQKGGEVNIVVDGINVGAQSYWNAEATMLMHTKGCLIMTPRGTMMLTGKRALDYSGAVSAEDNLGIGGFERIMGPNGQAQYQAADLGEACRILMRYYEHTYVAPGERFPRPRPTSDRTNRDVRATIYRGPEGFGSVGEILGEQNPGRKRPFDIRTVLGAAIDQDSPPLERWASLRDGESAVVWDAHLGGNAVTLIGIESRPLPRIGFAPSDGPDNFSGGTLFPLSSKKVARALNAASGRRPVVVLANLSGFDGSPESLRKLQLEYGAEIGRAVVNFQGPILFCVIARYHGGAYVVFSKQLNPQLKVLALKGSFASVIGGAPAAAVVFPEEARALALKDPRVQALDERLRAVGSDPHLQQERAELFAKVQLEKQREVADRFDAIHNVDRALRVGSLDAVVEAAELREALIESLREGVAKVGGSRMPPPAVPGEEPDERMEFDAVG